MTGTLGAKFGGDGYPGVTGTLVLGDDGYPGELSGADGYPGVKIWK